MFCECLRTLSEPICGLTCWSVTEPLRSRTNFTEPPPATPQARSRGVILADYLSPPLPNDHQSVPSPLDFLRSSLAPTAHDFAGFNVILFSFFPTSMLDKSASSTSPLEERSASEPDSPVEIGYLSNRSVPPDRIALGSHPAEPAPVERVTARIGGLSNSLLGDPWPKVCDSERGLAELLLEEQDDAQHECLTRNGVARQSWSEDKWIDRLEQLMRFTLPEFLFVRLLHPNFLYSTHPRPVTPFLPSTGRPSAARLPSRPFDSPLPPHLRPTHFLLRDHQRQSTSGTPLG